MSLATKNKDLEIFKTRSIGYLDMEKNDQIENLADLVSFFSSSSYHRSLECHWSETEPHLHTHGSQPLTYK